MSWRRHEAQSPSISDQLKLTKIFEWGDETGPKAGKQAAEKKTLYKKPETDKKPPMFLLEFDEDDQDKLTYNGEEVPTVNGNSKNSTELERKWLRDNYGDNWSMANEPLKKKMQYQARRVLSFEIAKKVIMERQLQEALATLEFDRLHLNELGLPKLDWKKDVLPALQAKWPEADGLNWTRASDGRWLTDAEKDERSNAVKQELRASKQQEIDLKRPVFVAERVAAGIAKLLEELNFPDKTLKRKQRALLRHWFNRRGKPDANGINNRVWNKPGLKDGEEIETTKKKSKKKTSSQGVTYELHKARMTWAKSIVENSAYDPSNPPQPPTELYTSLDIQPLENRPLLDEVQDISAEGGQWLWLYMRSLESMAIETKNYTTTLLPIEESRKYWDPTFRADQMAFLTDSYEDFILSVDEMSGVPGAKNIAVSYTAGSGRFNKYLLWPSSKVGGDPRNIPTSGSGAGGVAGDTGSGQIGPPEELHRLYKLINRCPRLSRPAVFLRAGNGWKDLPHNLGKQSETTPKIGRGYLNVTFMSTSSATPDQFTEGILQGFYNHYAPDDGCCLSAITCPANTPVLPLVLGGGAMSKYEEEQEVVLPPGLILVYQGNMRLPVGDKTPLVHFYQAELPPKVS